MNSIMFIVVVFYFFLCQYVIEKQPVKLKIVDYLDSVSFPKALILSLFFLIGTSIIGALIRFLMILSVAVTVFLASYLVARYRKILDRRMN